MGEDGKIHALDMLDQGHGEKEEWIPRKVGDWLWCLHCERCYQVGDFRLEVEEGFGYQMCPYEDCPGGDTVKDAIPWWSLREKHPEYPEVPERDRVYPLYG